ncbi:MAG: TauD/TfdA family dioxygenase [Hyphomicrobiales bacterium]|nr:TauD/TfdA family dioxygenase [Hyphomicrobiales bacterium]
MGDDLDFERITVKPLSTALGAEVAEVDLARLDDQAWTEIERAYHRYMVLFFRDQSMTPEEQVNFAARFGPVDRYPFGDPIPEHQDVVAVVAEPDAPSTFGALWRSDTPFLERPPAGSVLYARHGPGDAGEAQWADLRGAYAALSPGLRTVLDGLRAVHRDSPGADGTGAGDGARDGAGAETRTATHPVVRTHPVTGERSLYLCPAHTARFDGMTEDESAPLLDYLYRHGTRAEFTCRLRWEPGTVAVWDSRCTWRTRLGGDPGQQRVLHRVSIGGERPE